MPGEQMVVNLSQPVLAFHPHPKTFTWEMLEDKRQRRLKVDNKYSRHFNVLRSHRYREDTDLTYANQGCESSATGSVGELGVRSGAKNVDVFATALEVGKKNTNSIAPFTTLGAKSTCGYYFNWSTVNNKMKIGIPPTNTVKWRTTQRPT